VKVHITINDFDDFDTAVALAKEAIKDAGNKKAGDITAKAPHFEFLPHGGVEFDGQAFDEEVLGSWRIGKE
jgi:hypothetical protein